MTDEALRRRRIGSSLVAAQFALIAVCVAPIGPVLPVLQVRPVGVALLGLSGLVGALALRELGADTRVHPVPGEGSTLRTGGVYAHVRHPMYLAVLTACAGVTAWSGRLTALLALLLLIPVLAVKARFEDGLLAHRYGASHADYVGRVPAILPRVRLHRRR